MIMGKLRFSVWYGYDRIRMGWRYGFNTGIVWAWYRTVTSRSRFGYGRPCFKHGRALFGYRRSRYGYGIVTVWLWYAYGRTDCPR